VVSIIASAPNAIIDCNAIIDGMAGITIRNLEESTKRKLKIRAAMNGRSMEQEAREILKSVLARAPKKQANLAERIRDIFSPLGGIELEPLFREPIRNPEWIAEGEGSDEPNKFLARKSRGTERSEPLG